MGVAQELDNAELHTINCEKASARRCHGYIDYRGEGRVHVGQCMQRE